MLISKLNRGGRSSEGPKTYGWDRGGGGGGLDDFKLYTRCHFSLSDILHDFFRDFLYSFFSHRISVLCLHSFITNTLLFIC